MTKIINDIGKYIPFMQAEIQKMMRYKASFITFILGDVVQLVIMISLWNAIFGSSETGVMSGFHKSEMIAYIVISFIVSEVIHADIEFDIAEGIRRGDVAINLIRPISFFKTILSKALGGMVGSLIIIAIPFWIVYTTVDIIWLGGALPSITNLFFFLISGVLGYIMLFLFNFLLGLTSFYITSIWGVSMLKNALLKFISGQLIPIVFFPACVANVLRFLPFSSINYTPVMIYLGKLPKSEILFSFGVEITWIIILWGIYKIVWKNALKKLTVLGG